MGRLEIFKEGAPYGSGPMQKLHQRQLAGWHCFDVKTLFRGQKLCLERESFAPAALRDFLSGCATLFRAHNFVLGAVALLWAHHFVPGAAALLWGQNFVMVAVALLWAHNFVPGAAALFRAQNCVLGAVAFLRKTHTKCYLSDKKCEAAVNF